MKSIVVYRYIGDGAALAGVPARDLSEEEAQEFGIKLLLSRGLYRKDTQRIHIVEPQIDDELEV
jgi:hypothetical protein